MLANRILDAVLLLLGQVRLTGRGSPRRSRGRAMNRPRPPGPPPPRSQAPIATDFGRPSLVIRFSTLQAITTSAGCAFGAAIPAPPGTQMSAAIEYGRLSGRKPRLWARAGFQAGTTRALDKHSPYPTTDSPALGDSPRESPRVRCGYGGWVWRRVSSSAPPMVK
jgi:hypothetical protein